jgi:hypothetical protein
VKDVAALPFPGNTSLLKFVINFSTDNTSLSAIRHRQACPLKIEYKLPILNIFLLVKIFSMNQFNQFII